VVANISWTDKFASLVVEELGPNEISLDVDPIIVTQQPAA
jgi:hypothetical protein